MNHTRKVQGVQHRTRTPSPSPNTARTPTPNGAHASVCQHTAHQSSVNTSTWPKVFGCEHSAVVSVLSVCIVSVLTEEEVGTVRESRRPNTLKVASRSHHDCATTCLASCCTVSEGCENSMRTSARIACAAPEKSITDQCPW